MLKKFKLARILVYRSTPSNAPWWRRTILGKTIMAAAIAWQWRKD